MECLGELARKIQIGNVELPLKGKDFMRQDYGKKLLKSVTKEMIINVKNAKMFRQKEIRYTHTISNLGRIIRTIDSI